jgi:5,10-methylenetetrahydromethanopterin reductase
MTNAAAIATLEQLAPGRLVVAVGSGFTGRLTLGQRPLKWSFVAAYIRALRALLRGEEVEWEGALIRMMHPDGFAPKRPIEAPLLVGAGGPKGMAVAREVGDGVFVAGGGGEPVKGFDWVARLAFGTVLDDGEDAGSERSLAAAGHAAAVTFHALYERGRTGAMPGGDEWLRAVEAVPAATRHLALHDRHLVSLNDLDRLVVTGDLLARLGLAMPAEGHRARLERFAAEGVTEVAYQPAGPDIPRELRAFAEMAGLTPGPAPARTGETTR